MLLMLGYNARQALLERKAESTEAPSHPCAGLRKEVSELRSFIDGLHDGTRDALRHEAEHTRAQIANARTEIQAVHIAVVERG
jgi:hypothetical protein